MSGDRLLRLVEVRRLTGLSKTTIYRLAAEGRFPKPMRLGWRIAAWSAAEVDAWLAAVTAARELPRRWEPQSRPAPAPAG